MAQLNLANLMQQIGNLAGSAVRPAAGQARKGTLGQGEVFATPAVLKRLGENLAEEPSPETLQAQLVDILQELQPEQARQMIAQLLAEGHINEAQARELLGNLPAQRAEALSESAQASPALSTARTSQAPSVPQSQVCSAETPATADVRSSQAPAPAGQPIPTDPTDVQQPAGQASAEGNQHPTAQPAPAATATGSNASAAPQSVVRQPADRPQTDQAVDTLVAVKATVPQATPSDSSPAEATAVQHASQSPAPAASAQANSAPTQPADAVARADAKPSPDQAQQPRLAQPRPETPPESAPAPSRPAGPVLISPAELASRVVAPQNVAQQLQQLANPPLVEPQTGSAKRGETAESPSGSAQTGQSLADALVQGAQPRQTSVQTAEPTAQPMPAPSAEPGEAPRPAPVPAEDVPSVVEAVEVSSAEPTTPAQSASAVAESTGALNEATSSVAPLTGTASPGVPAGEQPGPQETPLSDQITAQMTVNDARAGKEVVIQMNPPELGKVRIAFRQEGHELRGVVRAENPQTLQDLQREAPHLLARLQEAGVQLKTLDLQGGDLAQQNHQDRGQHAQQAYSQFTDGGAQGRGQQPGQDQPRQNLPHAWAGEEPVSTGPLGQYISETTLNVMM